MPSDVEVIPSDLPRTKAPMSSTDRLTTDVKALLSELSGLDPANLREDLTFLDLGFDSLVLTQVAQAGSRRWSVTLKLRDFLEHHPSIGALVSHLAERGVSVAGDDPAPATSPAPVAASDAGPPPLSLSLPPSLSATPLAIAPGQRGPVVDLIRAQLELMQRQLEVLAGTRGGATASALAATPTAATPTAATPAPATPAAATPAAATPATPAAATPAAATPAATPTRHGPQLVIDKNKSALSPTQERHLAKLITRYGERTRGSKSFTERNRAQVADPRVPAGFKPALKELVYPIVVSRSSGAHLWDVDGHRYVDLLNGYGSNFFGYGAPFVKDAIRAQLEIGMEIGPQTPLIEEVAALFRTLVPTAERVAFCNTGSEAVLACLRLARTVTARDRVVMFQGGYHGMFDEVVARGLPGGRALPAAPGIPRAATENLVILDWGTDDSLAWVRAHIDEIAAVIVEPVQSRRPELQPIDFLRELRTITATGGAALIFDEVVTGFRVAPGGAQSRFGITADLASYGKVIGGGLSIGVVAGKREFMDALDGGAWQFGDDSIPEVGVTYFAGTFVRHPIHLAAAKASLAHLIAEGPALQQRVDASAERLAKELDALFTRKGAPLAVKQWSSIFKFVTTTTVPLGEIMFAHVRERGVHAWDGRPSFFTAAHTDADIAEIVSAFSEAIDDMAAGGFYPRESRAASAETPPVPGAKLGRDRAGNPAWFVPDPAAPGRFRQVEP